MNLKKNFKILRRQKYFLKKKNEYLTSPLVKFSNGQKTFHMIFSKIKSGSRIIM